MRRLLKKGKPVNKGKEISEELLEFDLPGEPAIAGLFPLYCKCPVGNFGSMDRPPDLDRQGSGGLLFFWLHLQVVRFKDPLLQ